MIEVFCTDVRDRRCHLLSGHCTVTDHHNLIKSGSLLLKCNSQAGLATVDNILCLKTDISDSKGVSLDSLNLEITVKICHRSGVGFYDKNGCTDNRLAIFVNHNSLQGLGFLCRGMIPYGRNHGECCNQHAQTQQSLESFHYGMN